MRWASVAAIPSPSAACSTTAVAAPPERHRRSSCPPGGRGRRVDHRCLLGSPLAAQTRAWAPLMGPASLVSAFTHGEPRRVGDDAVTGLWTPLWNRVAVQDPQMPGPWTTTHAIVTLREQPRPVHTHPHRRGSTHTPVCDVITRGPSGVRPFIHSIHRCYYVYVISSRSTFENQIGEGRTCGNTNPEQPTRFDHCKRQGRDTMPSTRRKCEVSHRERRPG